MSSQLQEQQLKTEILDSLAREPEAVQFALTNDFFAALALEGVMTRDEQWQCEHKVTPTERRAFLYLDILRRKTMEQLATFTKCLRTSGQSVMADKVVEKFTSSFPTTSSDSVWEGITALDGAKPSTSQSGPRALSRAAVRSSRYSTDDRLSLQELGQSLPSTSGAAYYEDTEQEALLDGVLMTASGMLRDDVRRFIQAMRRLLADDEFTKVRPMPSQPQHSFEIEELYVNLELERSETNDSWGAVIDYEASLKRSFQRGVPVIVRGPAGIGKTTFFKRICYDWASGEKFTNFHLVLPCKLREAEACDSIFELALRWAREILSDELKPVINRLIEAKSQLLEEKANFRVLVVLDGWDEDASGCQELKTLLKRQKQRNFSLLVTTRPMVDRIFDVPLELYQLTGLKDEERRNYIDKFLGVWSKSQGEGISENQEMRRKQLKHHLSIKPHLNEMARVPLLLCFICLAEKAVEAESNTELYKIILRWMLEQFEQKGTQPNSYEPFDDSEDSDRWLKDERIVELGRIALQGLLQRDTNRQLQFRESDLKKIRPDLTEIFQIGFLCREATSGKLFKNSYNVEFPHKSIQEFFAAVFLHSHLRDENTLYAELKEVDAAGGFFRLLTEYFSRILQALNIFNISKNTLSESRLDLTLVFLCGLVEENESQDFEAFLYRNSLYFCGPLIENDVISCNDPVVRECRHASVLEIVFRSILGRTDNKDWVKFCGAPRDFIRFVRACRLKNRTPKTLVIDLTAFPSNSLRGPDSSPANKESGEKTKETIPCEKLYIYIRDSSIIDVKIVLGCIKGAEKVFLNFDESGDEEMSLIDLIDKCPNTVKEIIFWKIGTTSFLPIGAASPETVSVAREDPNIESVTFYDIRRAANIRISLQTAALLPSLRQLTILADPYTLPDWRAEDGEGFLIHLIQGMENLEKLYISDFLLSGESQKKIEEQRPNLEQRLFFPEILHPINKIDRGKSDITIYTYNHRNSHPLESLNGFKPDPLTRVVENHPDLIEMNFYYMRFVEDLKTDVQIAAAFPNLRELSLRPMNRSFENRLVEANEGAWLLNQLGQMKNLEMIHLDLFLLNKPEQEQLKRLLPDCRIVYY